MIPRGWDISENRNTGRFKDGKPIIGMLAQNGLNDIKPDGSFVPCDLGIEEYQGNVTTHKVKRGRYGRLGFTDSASTNKHLCKLLEKDNTGLSFQYMGGNSDLPDVSNGKPSFVSDNGVIIEHTPTYKGVRIELVINDPLTAPIEHPFSIKKYKQDYLFAEVNGGIVATGDNGKKITIHVPYAVDANGDEGPVVMMLTGEVGKYMTFKKVVDETWLRQAAAPVKIDPDVTIEDGVDGGVIYDSFLNSAAPDANYGNNINIGLHENTPGTPQPGVIYVSLTDYGSVSWLNGKFILTPSGSGGGTLPYNVKVWRLKKPWTESTVTYNDADVAWQTPGAKGALDRAAVEESTVSVDFQVTDFPILVGTLNDYWGGDVDNNGILIEAIETGGFVHMASSEHGSVQNPQFYGEYTEAGAPALLRRGLGRGLNRGLGRGL